MGRVFFCFTGMSLRVFLSWGGFPDAAFGGALARSVFFVFAGMSAFNLLFFCCCWKPLRLMLLCLCFPDAAWGAALARSVFIVFAGVSAFYSCVDSCSVCSGCCTTGWAWSLWVSFYF